MRLFRRIEMYIDLLIAGFSCLGPKIEVKTPFLEILSIYGFMSPCTLTTMSFGTQEIS